MVEETYSVPEAAEKLGRSTRRIYDWIKNGNLKATKIENQWVISESAIQAAEAPGKSGYIWMITGKYIKSRQAAQKLLDDKMDSDSWTEAEREIVRGERSAFDEVARKAGWQ